MVKADSDGLPPRARRRSGSTGWQREALDTARTLIFALIIALLLRWFVVEVFVVSGPSMLPSLHDGERLAVGKVVYVLHGPQRGDIVVFALPVEQGRDLVKRVIATEGETVEVRGGAVYINGQQLDEPYIARAGGPDYPLTRVPPHAVWVLGDNREVSQDSRMFGPVDRSFLRGKAIFRFWPLRAMRWLP